MAVVVVMLKRGIGPLDSGNELTASSPNHVGLKAKAVKTKRGRK
jgi:hypothetical protein